MTARTFDAYLIKYALGSGKITKTQVRQRDPDDPFVSIADNTFYTSYHLGRDAFENLDEAVAAAGKLREKKIASLEKQIAKLRKMAFPVAEA